MGVESSYNLYITSVFSVEMALAQEPIGPEIRGGVMTGTLDYAQPLRAIGQALEILHVQSFEMEPVADGFFVRGTVPMSDLESLNDSFTPDKLREIWGSLPGERAPEPEIGNAGESGVSSSVELLYTEKDVERLEEEGRGRRVDARRTANPSTLSQMLRCLGGYLSQKRARLLKITRQTDLVSVEYETSMGTNMKETLKVADIYDIWVRMYLQRAQRAV